MPAGLVVYNDAGTVLIDDSNPSLALRQKVNKQTNSNRYVEFSFSGIEVPILALRCTTGWVTLVKSVRSGSTITYQVQSANPNTTFTCYLFDRPLASSTSGAGIQVYDAAGRITFDSGGKYGRVVRVQGEGTYNGTSGRTYAAVISSLRSGIYNRIVQWYPNEELDYVMEYSFSSIYTPSANQVQVAYRLIQERGPYRDYMQVPSNFSDGTTSVVIMDVTGY